jgi:tetratricopeptide (TPR) repeat protein
VGRTFQVSSFYGGAGPVLVEYRKEGYLPTRAIITDLSANDLTISLELVVIQKIEDQEKKLQTQDKLNSTIDAVFESQRLVRVGRQDDALTKLKTLENELPYLSAIYEMQGQIFYLQKKYREALDAYSQAVKYHPNSPESLRMRERLQTLLEKNEPKGPGP